MLTAFSLAFALLTPAADASSASVRDCAQEAEAESQVCHTGWLSLSGCLGGLNVAYYTNPEPSEEAHGGYGYTCDERARYILEAHQAYPDAAIQDIHLDFATEALDGTLEHCVDEGAWTCAQLARVSAATDAFLDEIDFCDADAEPMFEDFVAELNVAYLEQCIQDAARFEAGDRVYAP